MAKSKTKTVKKNTSSKKTNKTTSTTTNYTSPVNANYQSSLESSIDGSTRLFGIPHQFTAETDPRIGSTSNLGRCFAERMIIEAPIISLKPGIPDFLPGKSETEKTAFVNAIMSAVNGDANLSSIFSSLNVDSDGDTMLYYSIKDAYSDMMAKVNLMCKMMAMFLGISDVTVPWAPTATFGTYDWRYYSFKSNYGSVVFRDNSSSKSAAAFMKEAVTSITSSLMNDTQWVRFYVDSNASFSESSSNSTSTSMLESYTEKLEGIAKELDVVRGLTGTDVTAAANKAASTMDQYIQEHTDGNSAFGNLLKRISGNTTQIISGGNFLIPEIWSQSEYSKNYSFSITLSTPYGNPKSWFINIGVPLCHILGLCLPQQLTANTYKSPYFVKCNSKGWFNCNYGIIDGLSIDKGSDNSWSIGGLPNEIKVSLSVKDLYSTLSIPVNPYDDSTTFLNTGMLEFLMVNCGIDITHQDMDTKAKVWGTILSNNFDDRFTSKPYDVVQYFKSKTQGLFSIST